MANDSTKWLVRALVALAKRNLADANASCGDDWPAGQSWDQLGHTSQHSFMRAATAEAGIVHEDYRFFIATEMDQHGDELDALWQQLMSPNAELTGRLRSG